MSLLGRYTGSLVSRWDGLRESYWFLPMLMAGIAAGLAVGLIELDDRIASFEARRVPWIQDAGPEGTRALLSAVASSMITVTGVVFSITIVALTLASSQFGPRLLRNFLRDRGNQLVLGTFVATFLYSLLVLRAVEADRVPHVATAGALALAVASIFVLIYFVHHATTSIQASSVIASVAGEIESELPHLFPERIGEGASRDEPEDSPTHLLMPDHREIIAGSSGYIRVLDGESLLEVAVEHELQVELLGRPGDFVAAGAPLARSGPAERSTDEVVALLAQSFVIGAHRTAVQDLAFLTDQLAEMAVRALSPGVNDPRTAVACIHRLGVVIALVSDREMPSADRYDESGELRVLAKATTFQDIVASCLDPIRRYGGGDPEVVEAAIAALADAFHTCTDGSRREILREHASEWVDAFAHSAAPSKRDRARVDRAITRFDAV